MRRISGHERPARTDLGPALEGRLGDFTILREIGRGGMGIVYEAIDPRLGRRVAIKVMERLRLASSSARARVSQCAPRQMR